MIIDRTTPATSDHIYIYQIVTSSSIIERVVIHLYVTGWMTRMDHGGTIRIHAYTKQQEYTEGEREKKKGITQGTEIIEYTSEMP